MFSCTEMLRFLEQHVSLHVQDEEAAPEHFGRFHDHWKDKDREDKVSYMGQEVDMTLRYPST